MENKLSKEKIEQIIGRKLTNEEYTEVVGTVLNQLLNEKIEKSNG
ncbi:hypothetical protein NST33_17595 [Paenibacillus sp. FSL L8-0435]|uniref:Uncharacterized protein n=1 Tax=Paenibacillus barcinonensis TaxID=198119 RepID=A0A2V4WGZ9_PAEBA|nr:hypothetical protein [Paenibacillus barcinonensis]PYE51430.1 hypothetical protein DFQ00_102224 [Paenibacillus barcinonensis]